jgi:single-stranded DNA-binding protein
VSAARQIKKGDRCYVEGQLSASIWKTNDGEARLDLTIKAFVLQKTAIGKSRPPRDGQRIDCQAPIERRERVPAFDDELGF